MKKFFYLMAMAIVATAFTVSCGSDDDDDNNALPQKSEIKGLVGCYIISVTQQMAQLCDYTMTYYDINGKLTTEQATWTTSNGIATWTKDVSSTVIPATFGIKVNVKVKDNAQLDDIHIDNIQPVTKVLYLQGVTTDGKKAWDTEVALGAEAVTTTDTSGKKLPEYIARWEQRGGIINKTYTFDKDGNQISSGKIE